MIRINTVQKIPISLTFPRRFKKPYNFYLLHLFLLVAFVSLSLVVVFFLFNLIWSGLCVGLVLMNDVEQRVCYLEKVLKRKVKDVRTAKSYRMMNENIVTLI